MFTTSSAGRSLGDMMAGQRATAPSQTRRLSDPSASGDASATLRTLPVRSKDGTRWLPTPDEQLHRVDAGKGKQRAAEQPEETKVLEPHGCTAKTCAALQVLETTELLELILVHLDTETILSLQRTNHHWHSTIRASPQLRLHFFVNAQWKRPSSDYELLPVNLSGVTVEKDEPIDLGQWIKVTMTLEAARRICPDGPKQRVRARSIFEGLRGGLGRSSSDDAWPASTATSAPSGSPRHESLFITQPPILNMQAYILVPRAKARPTRARMLGVSMDHPDDAPHTETKGERLKIEPSAVAKLSCETGITLGFLAETALELLGPQTSGPSTAKDVKVMFKTIVSFCQADATHRRGSRRNLRTVTRIG